MCVVNEKEIEKKMIKIILSAVIMLAGILVWNFSDHTNKSINNAAKIMLSDSTRKLSKFIFKNQKIIFGESA